MRMFVWMCGGIGGEVYVIEAKNQSHAYDKAINRRMISGQTKKEAEARFKQEDLIEEVQGTIL